MLRVGGLRGARPPHHGLAHRRGQGAAVRRADPVAAAARGRRRRRGDRGRAGAAGRRPPRPRVRAVPGLDLDATLTSLGPEIETIRAGSRSGVALVSICVGAFLLAAAGLLDGRESTTSWLFADRLADRCPGTDVRPEKLVVTDSGVTTTGAFSAMYDFALGLIREHNGSRVARATARVALVDDARLSQAPYVDAALLPATGSRFSQGVQRWLDQNMRERYDLGLPAATFHVSTRTLLRRFRAETGQTPLEYLQAERVRRAKHLLETTERTVAGIAAEVGYRDPGTFSAVFTRLAGHRPRDYRATFGARP
ncbi:GlxA family transcriptional regulator [Amycolatopsis sp.]|uniref:GlxA family transcriptional regulator n=1 Tax=Amycolatopsis sp. TaxID=37632 RepID=UPI002D7EBA1D|nr:helix-turn-helix domain-containing protein [Amycolatopsis sp.]HET6708940.1 helix-turn-helix domain-containing protein [Amycolatopsis sp.]